MEHSFPILCLEQLVVTQSKEYSANKTKNGMNRKDHKKMVGSNQNYWIGDII